MKEPRDKTARAIGEVASEWVVKMHAADVSDADARAFMEWLRRSPQHVAEYLHAEKVFFVLEGAAREDATDVAALLREHGSNIVELQQADAAPELVIPSQPSTDRSRSRWFAAAAAVVATVGVSLFAVHTWRSADTFATGTGEQRRIVLDDGSTVDLNTRSSVKVHFTDATRRIELAEGEAFFSVAKDPGRPFIVSTGTAEVRAVGTQFNVYRQQTRAVVTVVEGKVAVTANDAAVSDQRLIPTVDPAPIEISAGEEVAVDLNRAGSAIATPPANSNTRVATAWRQRRLIFENQTLSEVASEFNRYNRRKFVVEDAQLGAELISGVFDADRPDDLVSFLEGQGNVRVQRGAADEFIVTRAEGI
ncbi:FecR family protein [Steroidobacter sp.]|uniref:FecR family protein n=1 Tax=Steroidobacter sp. TaxID=1978227 RepID=UPI001A44E8AF|nr:FecR domain-containing protein [Steroidobacter sp.]MBL8271725.1 FecR domain-containing protein [Steroidobacter sp.]